MAAGTKRRTKKKKKKRRADKEVGGNREGRRSKASKRASKQQAVTATAFLFIRRRNSKCHAKKRRRRRRGRNARKRRLTEEGGREGGRTTWIGIGGRESERGRAFATRDTQAEAKPPKPSFLPSKMREREREQRRRYPSSFHPSFLSVCSLVLCALSYSRRRRCGTIFSRPPFENETRAEHTHARTHARLSSSSFHNPAR